jgi:hypothetical protein
VSLRLYLNGGEVAAHAKLLRENDWTNIGVSFWHLYPRLPKKVPWTVSERLSGASVLLDSGGSAADKAGKTQGELHEYAEALQEFTFANADALDLIIEFDCLSLGRQWIEEQRRTFEAYGQKFVPVWHPEYGYPELERLAEQYERVAIPEDALDDLSLPTRINGLVAREQCFFHALGNAKPDTLRQVRFSSADSGSWLSPTRYGETIIWDGQKLHRYPMRMKDQARRRQTSAITRAGFDAALVAADDNEEITRLALWSLRRMADSIRPVLVADNSSDQALAPVVDLPQRDADNSTPAVRNAPLARDTNDRAVLPVIGMESVATRETDDDGAQVIGERLVPRLNTASLRQCDTCFVNATCPAMKPAHSCAFDLPVKIETKDQLVAVLNAVIEMQTQRVMFGRFAEELAGGYPDANLSVEVDRLFRLVTAMKRLEENHAFVRMSVEASAGAGMMSRIFGAGAGQKLRELPGSIDTDTVISEVLHDSDS